MQRCFVLITLVTACADNSVDSNEAAKQAYLGLDGSIPTAITLGFAGFNAVSSANIAPQTGSGAAAGTITVTGQVDQGSSANKGMRLNVDMAGYSDGDVDVDGANITIIYDTGADPTTQPFLSMQLKGIPTGTLSGTLMGAYQMSGDLDGEVELNLTFDGALMAGPNNTVMRAPGTTTVTGTATQGAGSYAVMVML
jgi:hypothetical protein